jgi:hypothetical protein
MTPGTDEDVEMLKRAHKTFQGLLAKGPANIQQREAFVVAILLIKQQIKEDSNGK